MLIGMPGLLCYTMVMLELPDLEVSKEFLQDHIVGQEIVGGEVVRPIAGGF